MANKCSNLLAFIAHKLCPLKPTPAKQMRRNGRCGSNLAMSRKRRHHWWADQGADEIFFNKSFAIIIKTTLEFVVIPLIGKAWSAQKMEPKNVPNVCMGKMDARGKQTSECAALFVYGIEHDLVVRVLPSIPFELCITQRLALFSQPFTSPNYLAVDNHQNYCALQVSKCSRLFRLLSRIAVVIVEMNCRSLNIRIVNSGRSNGLSHKILSVCIRWGVETILHCLLMAIHGHVPRRMSFFGRIIKAMPNGQRTNSIFMFCAQAPSSMARHCNGKGQKIENSWNELSRSAVGHAANKKATPHQEDGAVKTCQISVDKRMLRTTFSGQ